MIKKDISSEYDVIVIGAGHAGIEASHACFKLGLKTLLVCFDFKMASNIFLQLVWK